MNHKIVVTNARGESLPLIYSRPETSGLYIINVSGLGPVEADIIMQKGRRTSGSERKSSKRGERNIVISLGYLHSPSIEAARLRAYKFFPVEGRVELEIHTDAGIYLTSGYVESHEPTIFSISSGCVISIVCPDPYFYKPDGIVSGNVTQTSKLFTFPFSSEIGVPSIVFGEKTFTKAEFVIPLNYGNKISPTFRIDAVGGQVDDITIFFQNEFDGDVTDHLRIAFSNSLPKLEDGDYLLVSTEPGAKRVQRYVASLGTLVNYMGAITPDSSWPVLTPGDNHFSYSAVSGGNAIRLSWTYEIKFDGV